DCNSFEIVVADDASRVNPKEALEEYFAQAGFTDYQIIIQETNIGTVKNTLEGTKKAKGEFIKIIGAGDLLYASDTLRKMYEFCSTQEVNHAFGKIKTFTEKDEGVTVQSFDAPTKPELYNEPQNREAILTQMLIYSDWVPGGAIIYRRDYLIDFLVELAEDYQVRYCEDLVSVLVAFKGTIKPYDEFIMWYEWGVGVSNDGSKASRRRAYDDHTRFFAELKKRHKDSSIVARAYRMFRIKRFVMLYTPLALLLQRIKARQYLKKPIDQVDEMPLERSFLLKNLSSHTVNDRLK
ncbi:MAG: glycosyltransferase, partial [Coriobacteriia bacterium]|nr:glycosyltransferase [Coriobacteriia bacterium]